MTPGTEAHPRERVRELHPNELGELLAWSGRPDSSRAKISYLYRTWNGDYLLRRQPPGPTQPALVQLLSREAAQALFDKLRVKVDPRFPEPDESEDIPA